MTIVSISIANNRGIINVKGVINVKNTMITELLQYIAPNYCCGCGLVDGLLCDSCVKNIALEPFLWCVACSKRPAARDGICVECKTIGYDRAWVAGSHEGALDQAIDAYKFSASRDGAVPLAKLVDEVTPNLPANTVIVPIPTARQHIRERGFDHMQLLARRTAKLKGVSADASLLRRRTNFVQREATARVRKRQAKDAFFVKQTLDPEQIYLLIDDVMTTGATIRYATKALRKAGAKQVWVIIVARQMLSKN